MKRTGELNQNKPRIRAQAKWLMALAIMPFLGCGNPCRDLSERVCGCLQPQSEQQRCLRQVDALSAQWRNNTLEQHTAEQVESDAGASQCVQLLQSCTCAALEQGDLAACGLSVESYEN